jgi:formyl-CoA transferase/CoA:oxalate CoA-transferase
MDQPSSGLAETSPGAPLAGLKIVDLSVGLAGSFCTLLLADLGADVVKVNWRVDQHHDDREFIALERNKRIWSCDLSSEGDREALSVLLAKADALIESFSKIEASRFQFDEAIVRSRYPALIHCNLSAFGRTGPLCDKPACDLVVQALTGAMDITGEPDRPPVKMGIPLGEEISGLIAAITVLAAIEQRAKSGRGSFIDIAAFDANIAMLSYMANIYFATGNSPKKLGSSHPTIFPYNAFRTRDSYIVAAPFTQIFWRKLCDVLGRNDLPANPSYKSFAERLKNRAELAAIIDEAFLEHTTAEWRERLDRGDVPNGPVNSIGEALEMEQTVFRGMVPKVDDGGERSVRMLGNPFRFNFEERLQFEPAYHLPQRAMPTGWSSRTSERVEGDSKSDASAPLAGLRVLDLTRMFAGPYCCLFLADLGAEVIKIEEPRIGDPTRRNIPMVNGESTYYMAVNRGKKSVALDLKLPAAREAFLRLVEQSDVVVENYRPGVMDRLGLSYTELRKRKSDIILLSLSGFGQTGPMRNNISFDIVNQAMAGVMSVTGEEGRPPVRIGVPVGDLSGGIFGALAVMAALRTRRLHGFGAAIDLSLHDLMLTLLGPLAQEYLSIGTSPMSTGSSDRNVVPSRAYQASDGWIALATRTDDEWAALANLLDRPELVRDSRFRTNRDRVSHRSDVDREVQTAIQRKPVAEWIRILSAQGIAAAAIGSMGEAVDSEQARARGMVLSYQQSIAGACQGVGTAMRVDGALLRATRPPPVLGEHTSEVLRGVAGLSEVEFNELAGGNATEAGAKVA